MQIDSTNKRILLLGDIHQEIHKLDKIIKHEQADVVVTTGDWFDSFTYDSDSDVRRAAYYLKKSVFNSNFVSIIGNHDCHYLWPNRSLRCSGFEERKDTLIYEALEPLFGEVRDELKWFAWVDNWLITHAGVHPNHIPPMTRITREDVSAWLDKSVALNTMALNNCGEGWFTQVGAARGGRFNYGGLVWLDWNKEFEPIDGLKQIVGHSYHRTITTPAQFGGLNVLDSDNLDIDCNLNEYLIIHNQKIEIKKYIDI